MQQFLTQSKAIQEIIKSFNLTKTLFVSSILVGEKYTGKKSLIKYLFPSTPWVDGSALDEVTEALKMYDELIIVHFEHLNHYDKLHFENKRIIAIADYLSNPQEIDALFAFIYHMPSLQEREEDIPLLISHFSQEAQKKLLLEDIPPIDPSTVDFGQNLKTLQRSIYQQLITQNATKEEIVSILYHHFLETLEGKNGYKDTLPIFEKPLIEAGLKKFGSQLKLSDVLGINRNTLRKKIHENNIHTL